MALTLNGTNQWPTRKELLRFGEGRSIASRETLLGIFQRISEAISATTHEVQDYAKHHPDFESVARDMLQQWEIGRKSMLLNA